LDQATIAFENEGGETYICGNPPYSGYNKQDRSQKSDLKHVFDGLLGRWGNLDYVSAWLTKSATYLKHTEGEAAFVTTNSICQGGQVAVLWGLLESLGTKISFAYASFKWSNLASHNAGITVVIVGLTIQARPFARLYEHDGDEIMVRKVPRLNGYLIPGPATYVVKRRAPLSQVARMSFGNHPYFATDLFMSRQEARELVALDARTEQLLRPIYGASEIVNGVSRMCLWIDERSQDTAMSIPPVRDRIDKVRRIRLSKKSDATALQLAEAPHRFRDTLTANRSLIAVPQTTSEIREYLPCTVLDRQAIVTFKCFALYDAPLWNLALVASRIHLVWIGAVCGRLEMRYSYSNTLGWNTFPVPTLTEKNRADLTRCAEDILLARDAHFPSTIAELYDPERMPTDLRQAHERNDEVLERIYIGRRFRNDTERLEKLFELYSKLTAASPIGRKVEAH